MNNVKRIMSIILLVIVATVAFGCTPKNDNTDDVLALVECREQAIAEVESYAQGLGEANYSEENWTELQEIVRDIITAIQTSNSKDEIAGYVVSAKTDIDNVVTYKEQMVAEIESYAQSKGQDNYSEGKWTELQDIVRDTITAIQTSNSKDEISGLVTQAKTDMDNVVTYKEQMVAEIESYVEELDEQSYSERNWTELQDIVRDTITAIQTSNSKDEISGLVSQAKTDIDGVLRKYQEQVFGSLQGYAQSKGQDNYYAYNWSVIQRILEENKVKMQSTDDKSEIDSIVSEAKRQIDEIRTKVQEDSGDLGPEPTQEEDLKYRARQWFLLKYVKESYPNVTFADIDKIPFEAYFGCYNGCVVGIIDNSVYTWGGPAIVYEYRIENYWFYDNFKDWWIIYKNGEFYNIEEAYYEAKILTIEDIKVIYQKYYDFQDPDGERFNDFPDDPMNPNKTN